MKLISYNTFLTILCQLSPKLAMQNVWSPVDPQTRRPGRALGAPGAQGHLSRTFDTRCVLGLARNKLCCQRRSN